MTDELIETCGTCKYGVMSDPTNLMVRECFGAPPTPVITGGQPMANGRMAFNVELMRPKLPADARACGAYKRKGAASSLLVP